MSKYVIKAVLSNPAHPEYGQVTIPFPIPDSEYVHTIEMLSEIGIGDAVAQDCQVDEIDSWYRFLNRLEGSAQTVNVDELDYLAKRLDSFDVGEGEQYAAMLYKGGYCKIEDMINLTFCCQQATVISDFSKLEEVGKDHLLHINGGAMSMEKFEQADGTATAMALILCGEGQITPYGVVYDNGMKLEQLYQGKAFPGYLYDYSEVVLTVRATNEPEDSALTFLNLPALQIQIDRALQRGGFGDLATTKVDDIKTAYIGVDEDMLPREVTEVLELEEETIQSLNDLCKAVSKLDDTNKCKLNAMVELAKPTCASEIQKLAEHMDSFDFIPYKRTAEEIGEYMVKESGHYEYDPNLEGYYDYGRLGRQHMEDHGGQFTGWGFISYEGTQPVQELMSGSQNNPGLQMGGMT